MQLLLFMNFFRAIRLWLMLLLPVSIFAEQLEIFRTDTCNLFNQGDTVEFKAKATGFNVGSATLNLTVTDFFGTEFEKSYTVELTQEKENDPRRFLTIELSSYMNGYYEMQAELRQGERLASAGNSFGVVVFNHRTREEVLAGDYRFGMKMFGPNGYFDGYTAMNLAAHLGLHWTRALFNQDIDELNKLPVKIIYKIEGFPQEAYDAERYGPMDEFKLRHFDWRKATLPLEEPYKKWLKDEVAKLPEEHYVFEIWNEAWGKVPEDDFAKVCQWSREVIKEVRPNAVVGPNLGTHSEYDSVFIKYGGMEGMDAVILHPYGHPERSQLRARVRGVRDFYERATGRSIDLYVTEYGSATPPQPEFPGNTERGVAALNVRRSLVFYVEDVKGFMPHTLGQSEKNPNDGEDWYGNFRRNMQPKPSIVALATAARLIDGTRYIGDIYYQPDVGAYLFEREGVYTLALWTNDFSQNEVQENTIALEVQTGVKSLTMVDIVGRETSVDTQNGKFDLTLDGNVVYLVGVSSKLEQLADSQPRSDLWVQGVEQRGERNSFRMRQPPVLDGRVTEVEWGNQDKIEISFSKVDAEDISGTGYVGWDENWLYVAVDAVDDVPMAKGELPDDYHWRKKLRNPTPHVLVDGLNVFVGAQPKYQIPSFLYAHDKHFVFAPKSEDGQPVAYEVDVSTSKLKDIPGVRFEYALTEKGWSAELAIPLSIFKDFPTESGATIAFEMSLIDFDPGEKIDPRVIRPKDANKNYYDDATLWNLLHLRE